MQRLEEHNNKIKAISADIAISVSFAGMPKVEQRGKYYYKAPDKSKMEIETPVQNTMIMKGNERYLKTANSGNFIKAPSSEQTAGSGSNNDLFQYRYLQQFELEIDYTKSKPDEEKYFLNGYRVEHNTKTKKLEIWFDNERGVITEYTILGNSNFPSIEVSQEYTTVSGCLIPAKTEAKVRTPTGSYISTVSLRNVRVNKKLSDNIFEAR